MYTLLGIAKAEGLLCFGSTVRRLGLLSALSDYTIIVTLSLSDEDFGKLVGGKTQAQRLFMSGKLKIKGDVMKVSHHFLLHSPPCNVT